MLDTAATAEFLSFPTFLKASTGEERGERFIYIEASDPDERVDPQGDVILANALKGSADYFLRYGNIDLEHITLTGPKQGIPDYNSFEIGRPVDVKFTGKRALVKAALYRGNGKAAEKANHVWESTHLEPPARWYPSVGGQIMARDPSNPSLVTKVRWTNIGLSRTPVNQFVPTITTIPYAALAKSWTAAGLDLSKALEAGYGTDEATLSGGAALRTQSLDGAPQSYWDFRERLAGQIRKGAAPMTSQGMLTHATTHYGLNDATAGEWVEKFMADLRAGTQRKSSHG